MNIDSKDYAANNTLQRYQDQIRKRRLSESLGCEIVQNDKLIRYAGSGTGFQQNYVAYANLEADTDQKIDEQFDFFSSRDRSWMWTVYDTDSVPDLGLRLEKRGMKVKSVEHLLTLELDRMDFSPSGEFEISRVETAEQLPQLDELFRLVWDDAFPWVRQVVSNAVINSTVNFEVYLLKKNGKHLSAGWMRLHENTDFASLWGGMTLPEHRGEGLYSEVAKVRCLRAKEKGFKTIWVTTWPSSRNALKSLGFQEQTKITNYVLEKHI